MTETFPGPPRNPPRNPARNPARNPDPRPDPRPGNGPDTPRSTWRERATVLAGFAVAALWTAAALTLGTGIETAGAAWMAAIAWAAVSSFALALRRGLRTRDWSAFRRHRLPDNGDLVDWSTKTGAWAWMRTAEEHERLMRGD